MPPFLPFSEARKNASKNPLRLASYMVLINVIIIIAAIVLHELGHLAGGILAGCAGGGIEISNIISPVLPGLYATLSCPASVEQSMAAFLGLSGFLFIIPFALAFAALRKRPEKTIALVVIGFSIILSGLDLMLIVPHNVAVYLALVAGIAVMCAGEVFLAAEHTDYSMHRKQAKKAAMRVSKHHQHR